MFFERHIRNGHVAWSVLIALLTMGVNLKAATIINIEIDPRNLPDPVYTGDDGVFSSPGGTVWNHVDLNFLADVNVNDLDDQFGNPTNIDVTFDAFGSIDSNGRPIELYAGGGVGILDIKSLDATRTYDIAVYTHNTNLSVTATDLLGNTTETTGNTVAVELPGDEGEYVLFTGLKPFDLGGGTIGISIGTNGNTRMAGLQIKEIPEPSSVGLTFFALMLLASSRRPSRRITQ